MDNIIYSYTTKQAVDDGVLIKIDAKISSDAGIKYPVYFTDTVWKRYTEVPNEFRNIQDLNGRLWDILFMFSLHAKNCSEALLSFKFICQVPNSKIWLSNEKKSDISFQHREITLKAVITARDIDDPSPAIFIMLPWED